MTHATIPPRSAHAHPDSRCGGPLPVTAAGRALRARAETDATSSLASGLRHGDALVVALLRSSVEPLVGEGRL